MRPLWAAVAIDSFLKEIGFVGEERAHIATGVGRVEGIAD